MEPTGAYVCSSCLHACIINLSKCSDNNFVVGKIMAAGAFLGNGAEGTVRGRSVELLAE